MKMTARLWSVNDDWNLGYKSRWVWTAFFSFVIFRLSKSSLNGKISDAL